MQIIIVTESDGRGRDAYSEQPITVYLKQHKYTYNRSQGTQLLL